MADDPAQTPATTTPPPATGSGNAPNFVDHGAAAAEIERLKAALTQAETEKTTLQSRVQELEEQVDNSKQQELEARLSALETENATLKTENTTLKTDAARTSTLAALDGKVRNPEAVAALLSDELRTKDGTPDIEAIIAKYPEQALANTTTATAPSGAGGVQTGGATNLEKAVESKDMGAINAAFDAELKGASQ